MEPQARDAAATGEGVPPFLSTVGEERIRITPAAAEKLAELMASVEEDDDVEAVRLFVTGAGCSGMTYSMTFADRRFPHDCVYEGEGFRIYVDAVALNFLEGVEVDYQELPGGESFVFNNVFAATGGSGTCSACGGAPV